METDFLSGHKALVWVDRCRPTCWSEVVGQKDLVHKLQAWAIEEGKGKRASKLGASVACRHLLLRGPPGCGKTTCALLYVADMLRHVPAHSRRGCYLHINSSDDTCRSSLQDRIRALLGTKAPIVGPGHRLPVILDEVDLLPPHSQLGVHDLMQTFDQEALFIFLCNDESRLQEALLKDLDVLHFPKVATSDMVQVLQRVCHKCGSSPPPVKALQDILKRTSGDLRHAISEVQKVVAAIEAHPGVPVRELSEKLAVVHLEEDAVRVLQACVQFPDSTKFIECVEEALGRGVDCRDLVATLPALLSNTVKMREVLPSLTGPDVAELLRRSSALALDILQTRVTKLQVIDLANVWRGWAQRRLGSVSR